MLPLLVTLHSGQSRCHVGRQSVVLHAVGSSFVVDKGLDVAKSRPVARLYMPVSYSFCGWHLLMAAYAEVPLDAAQYGSHTFIGRFDPAHCPRHLHALLRTARLHVLVQHPVALG